MRPIGKRSNAKRRSRPFTSREGWRAFVACLCIAPVLALATQLSSTSLQSIFKGTREGAAQRRVSDDELKTGSILFVPAYGERCRRMMIDNATWFIADDGYVDCKIAMSQSTVRITSQSSVRLGAIRDSFLK
jgi:hypothetical protein